jgi:hypothetical protein
MSYIFRHLYFIMQNFFNYLHLLKKQSNLRKIEITCREILDNESGNVDF